VITDYDHYADFMAEHRLHALVDRDGRRFKLTGVITTFAADFPG